MKNNGLRPTAAAMSIEMRRTYWVWAAMIQRCCNPKCKGYPAYGGNGIGVCSRWRDSFDAFLADMGIKPPGMSIDRMDNDLGYDRANCSWVDRVTQNRNRTKFCRYYEVRGRRVSMKEAWEERAHSNITYRSFVKRLVTRHWTIEKALNTPARSDK